MFQSNDYIPQEVKRPIYPRCQCCGRVLEQQRLRYCSRDCKDRFTFKLQWFNNLLRVVETQYATFFFTQVHLVLNILPTSGHEVYTYISPRLPGHKPFQDMDDMIFSLGQIWWGHRDKTKSKRRASKHVLGTGHTRIVAQHSVQPKVQETSVTVSKQLRRLKMDKNDLLHPTEAKERLKSAFRQAALIHHPDAGGNAAAFRQIYAAYQDLLGWVNNPTYQTRRGVPGQWCYVAGRNTWLKPL